MQRLGSVIGIIAVLVLGALFLRQTQDTDNPLTPEELAAVERLKCCLEYPLDLFKQAKAGDLDAQLDLGVAFAELGGDSKDPNPEAVRWLRAAADNGQAAAQNEMGVIFQAGFYGESIDNHKAMEWFDLAAANGDGYAHFNLARYFARGEFVDRDDTLANEHFVTSAELSYAPALLELGYRLSEGVGGARDRRKAEQLKRDALSLGYGDDQFFEHQLEIETDNLFASSPMIAIIRGRVKKHGSPWSEEAYQLGRAMVQPDGLTEDQSKALWTEYLNSETVGQLGLGDIMLDIFTPESLLNSPAGIEWDDPKLANGLFRIAAQMGHSGAQFEIGVSYRDGRGFKVYKDEARYWFGRAAAQGHPSASEALAALK